MALKSGEFNHEHRVRIGDDTRWIRQQAKLEYDATGRAHTVLGVTQDITEFKMLEMALTGAKQKAEEGRISVRNIRRNAKQGLEKMEKDGEVGKDDVAAAEKRLEGLTKKHTDHIDEMVKHKETELLEV